MNPITLDEMSKIIGVSRNQLVKDCKKVYGLTPIRFLQDYRLEHARKLLETTDLEITDIAFQSGFSDSGYFSKAFRGKYGITPTEWRNSDHES